MKAYLADLMCGCCGLHMTAYLSVEPVAAVCRNERCSEYGRYYDLPQITLKPRTAPVPASIAARDTVRALPKVAGGKSG